MLWEIGVLSLSAYGLYRHYYREEIKFKETLREICEKGQGFFNRQMETLKLQELEVKKYGYDALIGVPYGISFESIQGKLDLFKTNFGAIEIIMKRYKGSMIYMTIITKPFEELKYRPIQTKVNEIYVGYTHKDHVIINLDSFNNVLIAGCQGTGKSRLLLAILTNIITQNDNVDLYFAQVRKSDLRVFEDCKQVKYFSKTLEDTCKLLKYLDEKICIEREKLIDRYTKRGIYNITDYNKRFKDKQLSRIIIALDEFSFFMPNATDPADKKKLKNQCIDHIVNIVRVGRSSGLTIITSLQKPTKNSIPTDIKTLIATRISFKQMDIPSSVAVLNNGNAVNLDVREAIVQTNQEEHIKVPFIEHKILMQYIKDSIEKNHEYTTLPSEVSNIKLPKTHLKAHRETKFGKTTNNIANNKKVATNSNNEHKKGFIIDSNKENGIIDLNKFKKVEKC